MLLEANITNFRCLKSVVIDFAPLTAIVGPNGSGKSAVIDAIRGGYKVRDNYLLRSNQASTTLTFPSTTRLLPGYEARWSKWVQVLRLRLHELRQQNQIRKQERLEQHGKEFANVLATISRREREDLAREFCSYVPLYQDVDIQPTPRHGHHWIVFQDKWADDAWYTPDEVSDGSMLFLAILALRYQRNRPKLIAFEEPERGLHPYLLSSAVQLLRDLANGKLGEPIQVVLATHSVALLDAMRPEEVRFLTRDRKSGETIVRKAPVEDEAWEAAFDEYKQSLGEIWLSGSLGGVPGAPRPRDESAAE